MGLMPHTQIVICGFPRGGTSLLQNMMVAALPRFRYDEFESYYIHRIHRLGNIMTKAPLDVMHLEHIDRLNVHKKRLVILLVVRDVRDVITSRHPMLPDRYFIGYDHSWWPQDPAFSIWKYNAPGVIDIHRRIQLAQRRADAMVVRYEDLIEDPDRVQERLRSKFALNFQRRFSEYHKEKKRVAYRYEGRFSAKDDSLVLEGKAVTKARLARWRKSTEDLLRVSEQFAECSGLSDILAAYGYEDEL